MLGMFETGARIGVRLVEPVGRMLDYKLSEGPASIGMLVKAPLGPRHVLGVITSGGEGSYWTFLVWGF